MKNDILLFAIMFGVAWLGYTVAKDRLNPTPIISQETVAEKGTPDALVSGTANPSAIARLTPAGGSQPASKEANSPTDAEIKADAVEPKTMKPKSTESTTTEQQIEQVLAAQILAWNQGDLDGFMDAYWNDEALTISGGGDTTLGWEAVYQSYRQRYPKESMGKIDFTDLKTEMVVKEAAIVTGRFDHLMADETTNVNFSLIVKRIDSHWKIVHDHTSVANQ